MSDLGPTFADDLAALVAQAEALAARAEEIAELRAKEGRQLGTATQEQLTALAPALKKLATAVEDIVAGEVKTAVEKAAQRETERFERLMKGEKTA